MHRTGTAAFGDLAPVCEGDSPPTRVGESPTGVFVDCLARTVRKCVFSIQDGEEGVFNGFAPGRQPAKRLVSVS